MSLGEGVPSGGPGVRGAEGAEGHRSQGAWRGSQGGTEREGPSGVGTRGRARGARYLQKRRSLREGPARASRPPPPSPPPPQLPRAAPHVTRARAGGGAVAGPASGAPTCWPTLLRVRGGCRGNEASVEMPTTRARAVG